MISTDRFFLRPIDLLDVNEHYLSWFADTVVKKYIQASATTKSLDDLRQFVLERQNREDVLFLAIFDKNTQSHIGNIKFEPLNYEQGFAELGIMIGDRNWRGKKVGEEVIVATVEYLKSKNIKKIFLGVKKENTSAYNLYSRIGFEIDESNFLKVKEPEACTMVLNLADGDKQS